MQKAVLSFLAILSLNFALLSLPASAYTHTVVQREIRSASRNPTVYRRIVRRSGRHHHHHQRARTTRRITVRHH